MAFSYIIAYSVNSSIDNIHKACYDIVVKMRKGNSESVKSTTIITTNLNGWKERASQSHVNTFIEDGVTEESFVGLVKIFLPRPILFVDRDMEGEDNLFLPTLSARQEHRTL